MNILVLNKNYLPINFTTVHRAIIMLVNERAEIIRYYKGKYQSFSFKEWMQENNNNFVVPPAIRTLYRDNFIYRKMRVSRRNIYQRDNYTCAYCGKKFDEKHLNVDHVIPKSKGGNWNWENVVCSCIRCNNKKGARTPNEANMKLLVKPFAPRLKIISNIPITDEFKETWKKFLDDIT